MVLRIATFLALISLCVALRPFNGSVKIEDIKEFDFFWSLQMAPIRDMCGDHYGTYLDTLKTAIDSSVACSKVMQRWKFIKEHRITKPPKEFSEFCGDIVKAAGFCWHNILTYLETCHKSYRTLDRDRLHLFPHFMGAICLQNSTSIFPQLREPSILCVEQIARYGLSHLDHFNKTKIGAKLQARIEHCWIAKAHFQCSYINARTPAELFDIYHFADNTMDKIFRCTHVASIYKRLNEISKRPLNVEDNLLY